MFRKKFVAALGALALLIPAQAMALQCAPFARDVSGIEIFGNAGHANWSLINGRRGQIERGARVLDVSAAGDWSEVRVWYAPVNGLGTSSYPLYGFIYKDGSSNEA